LGGPTTRAPYVLLSMRSALARPLFNANHYIFATIWFIITF
jgi:hypothetical protein